MKGELPGAGTRGHHQHRWLNGEAITTYHTGDQINALIVSEPVDLDEFRRCIYPRGCHSIHQGPVLHPEKWNIGRLGHT
jgi:hypothetical protein